MRRIVLPARTDALYDALAFVGREAGELPEGIKNHIELATEEIFVNICSYAYPSGEGEVELLCGVSAGILMITFIDEGIPFNSFEQPAPDIEAPAEERVPGGLGIYFVKECMDEFSYLREEGKNILTLKKKLK